MRRQNASRNLYRELVVARYKEDIKWTKKVNMVCTVYDKSDKVVKSRISLPNIGREAHTYIHHILAHYDDLAEWTFFTQGNPFDHAPDFLKRLERPYHGVTPLTTCRSRRWLYPRALFDPFMKHLTQRTWPARGGHDGYVMRAWNRLFTVPFTKPYFGYAGKSMLVVPKANILIRSKEFYRYLMDLIFLDRGMPWALERLWLYIFGDATLYPTKF